MMDVYSIKQCTVAFHVDDLLITCEDMNTIEQLEKVLKKSFSSITVNKSKKHSYLAMNINILDDGDIKIDMVAYIKKVLEGKNIKKKAHSPATDTGKMKTNVTVKLR